MFRDELFQGRQLFPKRGDLGFGVSLFGPFVGHDFLGSRRNESFVRELFLHAGEESFEVFQFACEFFAFGLDVDHALHRYEVLRGLDEESDGRRIFLPGGFDLREVAHFLQDRSDSAG